jgi:membrane fusion protein, heavy metal efflux system
MSRWWFWLLGACAIAGTAAITVVIEHALHDRDEHEHEEEGHEDAEHAHDEHEEHGEHADEVALTDAQLDEAGVEIATVSAGKVVVTLDLPGELALDGEALAHVGPRVAGTVREIKKKLGDRVKKGDVLAVLDSRTVEEMQGEVQAARERLKLAKATFERKKRLYEEKIVSEKDFLEAKQKHAEAKVELGAAENALRAQTGGAQRAEGYSLVAPLSGTVVEWHVGLGEVLADDSRAYVIADLSNVWVNVAVYAKDLAGVRVGQRAQVRAEGIAEPVEGKINFISGTVDELTRSASARIVLENPGDNWRPGLFVTAEVEIDEVDAPIVVREAALQRHEGAEVVFVRDGEHIRPRPIEVGRHGHAGNDRVVEVLRGLQIGERYVAKNSFIIKAELGKGSAGHEH